MQGLVGGPDPLDAVERAIHEGDFKEIIVSTLPKKRSKWLRRDLIRQIERLGPPVTAVVPRQQSLIDALDESDDMKRNIIGIRGGMPGAPAWASDAGPSTGGAFPIGRRGRLRAGLSYGHARSDPPRNRPRVAAASCAA